MDAETAPSSGNPYTDSLADSRWIGTTLTFSFPTTAAQFTGYTSDEPTSNFEVLNAVQQAAVRSAFASIASFTNLTFTEVTGANAASATLRFGMTDATPTAHAYLPSPSELGGDSWFRNTGGDYDDPVRGNYAWFTFMHEIGHSLGLTHPHESAPPMPTDRDSMQYTVMSYRSMVYDGLDGYGNKTWGFSQTYMTEDIAALQFLYGANFNHNGGNSLYQWNPATGEMSINGVGQGAAGANVIFQTVWDGGGIDTFDLSNYVVNTGVFYNPTVIDLRPGEGSVLQGQRADLGSGPFAFNFFVAKLYNGDPRSLIENAVGTNGRDVIRGNDAANRLDGKGGGDGADEIFGFGGDDVLLGGGFLFGGDGNDTLSGGGTMQGGAGNDLLYGSGWLEGNEGDDGLFAADGNDSLKGGTGRDELHGGVGNDILDGGDQVDALYGDAGNDELYGGLGDDTLAGGEGNDKLEGGAGNDVLSGGLGDDIYVVEDASDQILELAGEGIDTIQTGISLVAPSTIENLAAFSLSEAPVNLTGNSLDNDISGSAGANVLDGGAGADRLTGWRGDDTFYVDNANDKVIEYKDGGTDTVYASVSYVLASTPSASDVPYDYGGASLPSAPPPFEVETLILTGSGNINGTGSEIANTLVGNAGVNRLDGKEGADTLIGGLGADELVGGLGGDLFRYASAAESVAGGEDWLSDFTQGADMIDIRALGPVTLSFQAFATGTPGAWTRATATGQSGPALVLRIAGAATTADFLVAGAPPPPPPADALVGTPGDDTMFGGGGINKLYGLAGNDLLDGLAGADQMHGGEGNDRFVVDNAADLVFENAGGGADMVFTTVDYVLTEGSEVESLSTRDWSATTAINITGSTSANTLYGNAGANILDGGGGVDTMWGFAGNDRYVVDSALDLVFEDPGAGNDLVYTTVDYVLTEGSEVESLSTRDWSATTAINITGSTSANALYGNAGANILDGAGGVDTMWGFAGDDRYVVDSPLDLVFEDAGGGNDLVYTTVDYVLTEGSEVESLSTRDWSATTAINITGSTSANALYGNAGANILDGAGGADAMWGFGGDDRYVVDSAGDQVFEDTGGGNDLVFAAVSYTLAAGVEVEGLSTRDWGASTAIDLTGNAFANALYGNAGANRLDGGAGADVLHGFAGADTFGFTTMLGGGNVDTLVDFASGSDRIALDDAVFTGLAAGALAAGAFHAGSVAADAGDRIVYDAATGALWFDVDGNGAIAAMQFATLAPGLGVTAGDFLVV